MNEQFKLIPSIDKILSQPYAVELKTTVGNKITLFSVKNAVKEMRNQIKNGNKINNIEQEIEKKVKDIAFDLSDYSLKQVINGTGIIIHTNLGRAVIPESVAKHITEITTHYSNLEYDITKGKRGHRDSHAEKLISLYFNVESACIVNNNAAAVMLILNTFAEGKEVVVSRGELVEIGGSFRIPEVMKKAGCSLVEVGATNRTHLSDYEKGFSENTGMVLKVHPSNYRISGFTKSVEAKELSLLCEKHNIVFAEDMGSGNIYDLGNLGINDEPKVSDSLKSGIKLLSFSGDKLLGSVQCGFIVGKKKYIDLIKKNDLLRALRVDKMVYAALEKHLSLLLKEEYSQIPVYSMLFENIGDIEKRINEFISLFDSNISNFLKPIDTKAKIGGGTTPEKEIDSKGISFSHNKLSAEKITLFFRNCKIPLIGRIENNSFFIDCENYSFLVSDNAKLSCSDIETIKKSLKSSNLIGRKPLFSFNFNNKDFVLRNYYHGGIFRNLLKDKFWDKESRCFQEFKILYTLQKNNFPVLEPFFAIKTNGKTHLIFTKFQI